MKNFTGKWVLITGAGNGIGRQLALEFARRGANLHLVDIKEEGLRETAALAAREGAQCRSDLLDVSDREAYAIFARTVLDGGVVDILVNNAGIICATAPFDQMPLEDVDRTLNVNLWGALHGVHFFLAHLKTRPEAAIINLSSAAGFLGIAEQIPYGISKAAVRSFSEGLRMELIGTTVEVVCVHPGIVDTRIVMNSALEGDADAPQRQAAFTALKGVSAESAARKIVRGLAKGRGRVLIAPESHLFDWVGRLFPVAQSRIMHGLMKHYTKAFED